MFNNPLQRFYFFVGANQQILKIIKVMTGVKPVEEGAAVELMGWGVAGSFEPGRQGGLLEEMLFEIRFGHLTVWGNQCSGPKAGTGLASRNGRRDASETWRR